MTASTNDKLNKRGPGQPPLNLDLDEIYRLGLIHCTISECAVLLDCSESAFQASNEYQPRSIFNDSALNDLASSIKEKGVIQPVIVRKTAGNYRFLCPGRSRCSEYMCPNASQKDRGSGSVLHISRH